MTAREALTKAVNDAIAKGAPVYVNQPAPTFAGRRAGAGHFSREVKTYTIASRRGDGERKHDVEAIVRPDGVIGWPASEAYNVDDVWHFASIVDATRLSRALGPHYPGATLHIVEW